MFVPKINVEFGASDDSVVDARRRLISQMNIEKNEALEAHLHEQWAYSLRSLPAEVAALVPKMPSQQFYEAHYYEYMMKLFGEKSQSTDGCQQPSLGAQSVKSVVGMRGILQKRPSRRVSSDLC